MKIANNMKTYDAKPRALRAELLRRLPDLVPPLVVTEARAGPESGAPCALVAEVRTPSGRRRRLCVAVRSAAAPSRLPHALQELAASRGARSGGYPVLASTFLSPRARELCREAGVGYLDLAGNCHLRVADLYLERSVSRNPFPHRGRPASLFSPVSSRLLRVLLEEPARRWRVSELASAAGASLGQTSNVCRRLAEEAYAAVTARRFQLSQPGRLLDAWRDAYAFAANAPAGYYSFEQDPERLARRVAELASARGWRYAVTSFAAAARVAPFVHGIGALQWYVGEEASFAQWAQALDLRPVESGPNAVLLSPYDPGVFHGARDADGVRIVGNIQLYLDLAGDPARGREQAEFLRRERIGF